MTSFLRRGGYTLVFALLMGPTMQASLKLFNVSHDPSPSLNTA